MQSKAQPFDLQAIRLPAAICADCGADIPEGGFRAMAGTAQDPEEQTRALALVRCEPCEVNRVRNVTRRHEAWKLAKRNKTA